MTSGKIIALTVQTFIGNMMSLLFNILSRFVIAFLQRSKHLFISWVQSPFTVILESKKIWSVPASSFPPFYLIWNYGTRCHDLNFFNVEFQASFSFSSFILIKRLFSSFLLYAIRVVSLHIWGYWYFSQQSWFQLVIHPAQHFLWCTLYIS